MLRTLKSTKQTSKLQNRKSLRKIASTQFSSQGNKFKKVGAVPTPAQPSPTVNKDKKPPQTGQTPPQQAQPKATPPPSQPTPTPAPPSPAPVQDAQTTRTESAPSPQDQPAHTPAPPLRVKLTTQPSNPVPIELDTDLSHKPKTAILMLNMGGPADPKETGSFLTNLFSDPMIINLGKFQWLGARAAKSRVDKVQKQYEKIGGSPISQWTHQQGRSLTGVLDIISPETAPHKHYVGFRYAAPFTKTALQEMKQDGVKRVVAFSQYPMYSCTTTGSSLNDLWKLTKELGMENDFEFTLIDRWHHDDNFHTAIAENIKQEIVQLSNEELKKTAILFSAHSVPLKTMNNGDQYPAEISHTVEQTMVKLHKLLNQEDAKNVNLAAQNHTPNSDLNKDMSFTESNAELVTHVHRAKTPKIPHQLVWQSKVGFLPWLRPSTSTAIEKLKGQGFTNAIIVPVAFTSDHIETLHEIDIEYKELAHKHGINLIRSESLNNSMHLTKAQASIVKNHLDSNEIVNSHQYRIKCLQCVQPEICRTVLGYTEDELFNNQRITKV